MTEYAIALHSRVEYTTRSALDVGTVLSTDTLVILILLVNALGTHTHTRGFRDAAEPRSDFMFRFSLLPVTYNTYISVLACWIHTSMGVI